MKIESASVTDWDDELVKVYYDNEAEYKRYKHTVIDFIKRNKKIKRVQHIIKETLE